MVVDGANPEMLWYNIADYIGDLSKSMIKTYNQRKRNNKAITWGELDRANRDLHNQLDIIISGDRNVIATNENKKMNKKQVTRINENQLRQIVTESVKIILKEWEEPDYAANGKYYVAADCDSDYFDDYYEAYNYALKLANDERKRFPDDWEAIHLMDNEEWQSIVIFNKTGIHNLENGAFMPWGD